MTFTTKAVVFSIVLAVIGYFVFPFLPFADLAPQATFAIALLIGGLVVSLISDAYNPDFSSSDEEQVSGEIQTLYVGNLAYKVNEAQLKELFAKFGTVSSVRLVRDRRSGKRKGYGFVEMEKSGAVKALKKLNDTEFEERTLKIREANERGDRADG